MRASATFLSIAFLVCSLSSFGQIAQKRDTIEILELFEQILNAQVAIKTKPAASKSGNSTILKQTESFEDLDSGEDDLEDLLKGLEDAPSDLPGPETPVGEEDDLDDILKSLEKKGGPPSPLFPQNKDVDIQALLNELDKPTASAQQNKLEALLDEKDGDFSIDAPNLESRGSSSDFGDDFLGFDFQNDEFVIENKFISYKSLHSGSSFAGIDLGGVKILKDIFGSQAKMETIDSVKYMVIEKLVVFKNCAFGGDFRPFEFIKFEKGLSMTDCISTKRNYAFKNLWMEKMNMSFSNPESAGATLGIIDCYVNDGIELNLTTIGHLEIIKSTLRNRFFVYHSATQMDIYISECEFILDKKGAFQDESTYDSLGLLLPITDFEINNFSSSDQIGELTIRGCQFIGEKDAYISLKGNVGDLVLEDNLFKNSIEINCDVERTLKIRRNIYEARVFIGSLKFSEKYNVFPYRELKGFKLAILLEHPSKSFHRVYTASTDLEVANLDAFEDLIRVYQTLHNIYKNIGARISSNHSYAEMKEIETRLWRLEYSRDHRFESYFRWRLNNFLAFFSDYGTNPALAVYWSIWVVVFFAGVYILFPSDWDQSRQNILLGRLKDLFSKSRVNTRWSSTAYILYMTFIHTLNAVTLSMNAFTTLGFGDIPTHGLARYMCIVEGLVGWFLLSIFSVSLINQVLA